MVDKTDNVIPFGRLLKRQNALAAHQQAKTVDRIAVWLEHEGYECAKRGDPHEANALVSAARRVRRGDWQS